jgi:membrane fusion protein (multidrug efflux system)
MSDAGNTSRLATRRRWLGILAAVVVIGAIAFGLYWYFVASHYQRTDDAYVGGDVVALTSREPGTILALYADNTQRVTRGQLIVELDPVKADAAVDQERAQLAQTVRAVRTNFAKVDQLRAQVSGARVALEQAKSDFQRRREAGNSVSHEELVHADEAVATTKAALAAAQSTLDEALAAVAGTEIATNPDVLAAEANLRQAMITQAYMRIYAPVSGIVAQRTAQLGEQVAAGTPLMAIIPLDRVWVDANFKEGQLENMRSGQPVTITTDVYGGSVKFHGRVVGLSPGSGNAFALLPPQNASGNWIKIVQRVPVRIALDAEDLRGHPLRIGESANARVDVEDTGGPPLAAAPVAYTGYADLGSEGTKEAARAIAEILAANSGGAK